MTTTIWTPTLAWLGAAGAALALASAGPNESSVMGQLPGFTVQRIDQQRVVRPPELTADRTLVLVAFDAGHRGEIDSWVRGLRLTDDPSIAWFKMPVLRDPGSEAERQTIENNLLARYADKRARLVPIFSDRQAFVRAAGLSSAKHASVLILDRDGKVLARAEGAFDQDKALALRETLTSRN